MSQSLAKIICFTGNETWQKFMSVLTEVLKSKLCLVLYSGGCPSVCLDGPTRALFLKLLPSSCLSAAFKHSTSPGFECCVHLAWTQADGAWSIHCTTQVKVIETGPPLPCSPVSKHMAAEHLERQRVRGTSWPRWERRWLTLWKQKVASTNHPHSLVACLREKSTCNHVTSCGYSHRALRAFRLASSLVIVDINVCNHELRYHRPVAQTAELRLIASMFPPC